MKIQKQHLIAVIGALFAAVALCACGTPDSGIVQRRRGTGIKTDEVKAQEAEELVNGTESAVQEISETELYILTKIDAELKTVSFQKVTNGRQSQYAYDTGTQFLDKYGSSKPYTSFLPGDAVQIEVSGHTQKLKSVQISPDVWVYDDIVNYSFDPNSRILTVGKTKYSCGADMEIFSGEGMVGFDNLSEGDVLRAVGQDRELISLSVTKGHGYLALANTKLFEGSFICIGDKIFKEVTKNMQIEVPEGKYLVTVANDGYGGSREVEILRDQTTGLNLDELKGEGPKICKITFHVGVEGAVLWIDDQKADYSKPVEVRYGIHTIAVEAEGYDTITEKLVVNSAEAEIEIALSETAGSASEEENTASGSANTNTNNNAGSSNDNNQNTNSNTNQNNTNNNTNNNNNNSNNNNDSSQSQTDYLTTLYNLLTSINNSGSGGTSNHNTDSTAGGTDTGSSYDDLRDQ